MKTIYYGEVNEYGYEIFKDSGFGPETVYQAGNHPNESTEVTQDLSLAVPVLELLIMCEKTGLEMAGDNIWMGAEII